MSHHVKLFSHTVTFNSCRDPIILVDRWGNRVTEMSVIFPRWHKHYVKIIMWIQAIQLHNLNHSTILTLMKNCLLSQIPLVPAIMLNPHSYKSWKQVSITNCHLSPSLPGDLAVLQHGWPERLQLTILPLPITEWSLVLQSHSFPLHPRTSQSLNKKKHTHSLTHIFI